MKKRIISAIILLLITVPIILIGKNIFALGIGIVGIMAFYEISKLEKYPNLVKITSLLSLLLLIFNCIDSNLLITGINYKSMLICLLLHFIPSCFYQIKGDYTSKDAFKLCSFIIMIGLGLNNFILIRNYSLSYFIFVLLLPILTDTFAYFGGMLIGKHKATKISPKKTWEGYIVGSLVATIIMTVYYLTFINIDANIILIVPIILFMTIAAELGDLFFSAIKRSYDIKDFSNLIPGHGGVVDRLDSLIFVSFMFIIFIEYL